MSLLNVPSYFIFLNLHETLESMFFILMNKLNLLFCYSQWRCRQITDTYSLWRWGYRIARKDGWCFRYRRFWLGLSLNNMHRTDGVRLRKHWPYLNYVFFFSYILFSGACGLKKFCGSVCSNTITTFVLYLEITGYLWNYYLVFFLRGNVQINWCHEHKKLFCHAAVLRPATLLVQPTNEVLAGDDCRGIFYFYYITGCVFYVQGKWCEVLRSKILGPISDLDMGRASWLKRLTF